MSILRVSPVLVFGDVASFVVFAVIGLSSHERDYSPAALARTILPFLLPWLAVAWASGLYRPGAIGETSGGAKPVLFAWLPAWAIGLALRGFAWGRDFAPAFAVVSLLFNAALLVGWRAAFASTRQNRPT